MDKQKKSVNYGELVIPALTVLFAVAFFIQTREAPMVAMKWPLMVFIMLAVMLALVIYNFIFVSPETGGRSLNLQTLKKPLLILIFPIVYILSMNYLGFALSSLIFLNVMFRLLGAKSYVRNLIVSIILVGLLHFALNILMQMSFPQLGIGILNL
ncbi:MAG: hypothetical protein C0602_11430 [Denitrovibrio sp.]|nr:MAG: hypothetical protein C0602_11430 [Denitrovibrio sp.]